MPPGAGRQAAALQACWGSTRGLCALSGFHGLEKGDPADELGGRQWRWIGEGPGRGVEAEAARLAVATESLGFRTG